MKLALGTVQFGLDYGISNKDGRVSLEQIEEILSCAKRKGISTIDTASLYGASEESLGQFDLSDFEVVTKTVKIDKTLDRVENFERFKKAFYSSQKKLGSIQLHGLMFHEANDLLSYQGLSLWDLLQDFKQKEYVRKIGVSVYSPKQLEEILNIADIDIVQLPLNIFDQRFLYLLPDLKKSGIEIHTRSAFLQGLLFINAINLDPFFEPIKSILKLLPENRLEIALSFLKRTTEASKIVVGVTKKSELEQIYSAYNSETIDIDFSRFKIDDEKFINPVNWRLTK